MTDTSRRVPSTVLGKKPLHIRPLAEESPQVSPDRVNASPVNSPVRKVSGPKSRAG
jgi:hypothetical protein